MINNTKKFEEKKMSDNPIGPIIGGVGGLIGIGLTAYAAKGIIDIVKDKSKQPQTQTKLTSTPPTAAPKKMRAGFDVDASLQRMLR